MALNCQCCPQFYPQSCDLIEVIQTKGVLIMDHQEKMNKWLDRTLRGEKGFQLLSGGQDGWNYQLEDQQGKVTSLAACVWEDNLIHVYHKWDEKEPLDTSKKFLAVVKDESKMIVAADGVGLFSFGMKDGSKEKYQALLFVQCDWYSTVVSATSNPPMVQVQSYVQDGVDPLATILPELFDHLVADYSGKEAAKNAGEIGPSDHVDLGQGASAGTEAQA